MSLIKSISGIRGTIGGTAGDGLSPLDIVKFTSAYAMFMRRNSPVNSNVIVVGRDARLSGRMVLNTVVGTLMGMGFDVTLAWLPLPLPNWLWWVSMLAVASSLLHLITPSNGMPLNSSITMASS